MSYIPGFVFALVATQAATSFAGGGGDGPANPSGRVWQVKYHRDNPNERHKAIAVRLRITRAQQGQEPIVATLTVYRSVRNGHYVPDPPYTLTGTASSGNGGDRKRGNFELSDGSVKVKGFHHTGRNNENSTSGRQDDFLIVRIIGLDQTEAAPKQAKSKQDGSGPKGGDDCDELPPDEDVLTEEDEEPDPPEYP